MNMGQEHTKEAEEAILRKYEPELQASKEAFNKFYHLDKTVLGEGITGKVYKCIRRSDGMSFALKALHKNGKAVREVVLHKRMQGCPYIVQIEAVFENLVHQKPVLFVVMELMAGGELFNAISSRYPNKPFSEREVAQLVLSLCKAVKSLHEKGIAHRDLKPENLLFSSIDENATIKLTDFGFAKESIDSLKTPNFTPYYGAPEVMKSRGTQNHAYDKSCDCWSLGVIIYILLCGYPPFYSRHGLALSPGMRDHISKAEYRFPEREWSKISQPAKDLIEKLLVVDPAARLKIDDVMRHPWLLSHRQLPEIPLGSADVLNAERGNWDQMRAGMSQHLETMRTDKKVTLNPVGGNSLFQRRKVAGGPSGSSSGPSGQRAAPPGVDQPDTIQEQSESMVE